MKHKLFVTILAFAVGCHCLSALEPGMGVKLKRSKPKNVKQTQLYFGFDSLENEGFANSVMHKKKYPAIGKGVVKIVKGVFGSAVNTPDNSFLHVKQFARTTAALTVDFWLKTGAAKKQVILLDTLSDDGKKGWNLALTKKKNLLWTVWHPDGQKTIIHSNRCLPQHKWSRVTLVFGSIPGQGGVKGYRIYINGYVAGEIANFSPIEEAAGTLEIRTPTDGAIDEFSISLAGWEVYPDIEITNMPVNNMDFEDGSNGWVGVYDNCQIDTKQTHGGQGSLKIETDDAYTREYLSPMFSVEPGAMYRISYWAKVGMLKKGYSAIGVWIRWYFEPEETCSYGGDLIARCLSSKEFKPFDWTKLEAVVSVPDNANQRKKINWARLQVKNYHSQVQAWIDDIKIEKIQLKTNSNKGIQK